MTSRLDPHATIRRLNWIGLATVAFLVLGVGGWAITMELSGAVIAPGTVVVQSFVKKVQHPTGGVVGEILVKEGDSVKEGQVVLRLDGTVTRATYLALRSQLDELLVREARLLTERDDGTELPFPSQLTSRRDNPAVADAFSGEQKLFEARLHSRNGQRSQLRQRIAQINEEIIGLSAQITGKEGELNFISQELTGVVDLYKKNLVTILRYSQLHREQARLTGERGQLTASLASARGKISELELQILQIERDFRAEVLKDLRDTQGRLAEIRERLAAAEDQLNRIELKAPQSGIVHQLSVHTVGGVIGNGELVMQIVPVMDNLVVEAKVAPPDIDQIALDAKATVKIMAGNQRTTPDLRGVVTHISADLTREQQAGQPALTYYTVRVTLPPEEVSRLKDIRLVPGMPAEVFIQTYDRTPMQYFLKPLSDQIARTFRER
jgi:HlyD family secretion protein